MCWERLIELEQTKPKQGIETRPVTQEAPHLQPLEPVQAREGEQSLPEPELVTAS